MNSEDGEVWPGQRFPSSTYRDPYASKHDNSESSPQLMEYDGRDAERFREYDYSPLPAGERRIRLLKLKCGNVKSSEIYCELIEAAYDEKFHIPSLVPQSEEPNTSLRRDHYVHDFKEEDGDRSDLETLGKETIETEKEEQEREVRQLMRRVAFEAEREMRYAKSDIEPSEQLLLEWRAATKYEQEYEALSWCWGDEAEDYAILIQKGPIAYRKSVRKELALALKHLRRPHKDRIFWVDAICINQADPGERNHQVQMMSRVYTRAKRVCIWLGVANEESKIAINFIKNDIKELRNFDRISSNEYYSHKWLALMSLMQRDWFFRRWVIQEIALARAATVYCGSQSVSWKSFAIAIELFVQMESATRLSETIEKGAKSRQVPGWFEFVSELGASNLVHATKKVFWTRESPMHEDSSDSENNLSEEDKMRRLTNGVARGRKRSKREDFEKQEKKKRKMKQELGARVIREKLHMTGTIDPLERTSLLSLEYLVTTMSSFQASEPRDAIYALLTLASDAMPLASSQIGDQDRKRHLILSLLSSFSAAKPFEVDYNRPYSEVCRDFVHFSIQQASKRNPSQALDILCRPWALEPPVGVPIRASRKGSAEEERTRLMIPSRNLWKIRKQTVEKNDQGYWVENGRRYRYRYTREATERNEVDYRSNTEYSDFIRNHEHSTIGSCLALGCTHKGEPNCTILQWKGSPGWESIKNRYFAKQDATGKEAKPDVPLPSWVARASRAPFSLNYAPGMEMRKACRVNADPLVGFPYDGHRNYSAAGSKKLNEEFTLKFKKRPVLETHSLYVQGFQLDVVQSVTDASQFGGIPREWFEMGDYRDFDKDPPDTLWRTLIADRDHNYRNPPYYYASACKESVYKGGYHSGGVDTTALIHNERNSLVSEFCRRVQAVIWGRCLFKTKAGRLGLASNVKKGDKVCILYGCTVPVILKEYKKTEIQVRLEDEEDQVEALKACVRRAVKLREQKARYRPQKLKKKNTEEWLRMEDARQAAIKALRTEQNEKNEISRDREDKEMEKRNKRNMRDMLVQNVVSVKKATEAARNDVKEATKSLAEAMGKYRTEMLESLVEKLRTDVERQDVGDEEVFKDGDFEDIERKNQKRFEKALVAALTAEKAAEKAEKEAMEALDQVNKQAVSNIRLSRSVLPMEGFMEAMSKQLWFEFKGECYLHGAMDGEAMQDEGHYNLGRHYNLGDTIFELR